MYGTFRLAERFITRLINRGQLGVHHIGMKYLIQDLG